MTTVGRCAPPAPCLPEVVAVHGNIVQVGVVLFNHGAEDPPRYCRIACGFPCGFLRSHQDFSVAIGDRIAQLILEFLRLHLGMHVRGLHVACSSH